ncbi:MAG: hypothetical protein Kow00108_12360 [Calditrichia bacterium]
MTGKDILEQMNQLLAFYNDLFGNDFFIDREALKKREKEFEQVLYALKSMESMPENASPLDFYRAKIENCKKCGLSKTRTKFVFGAGNPNADIMFIGEAPGYDEDKQGLPFVGKAGQLLTKILEAIHLKREEVYIANILKCRPPNNRTPSVDEIELCKPYLLTQIKLIQPKIICLLGAVAAKGILEKNDKLSNLRGRFHTFEGIDVLVTYHPAALLRNEKLKRPVWEDMKLLRKTYDEKVLNQPFILEEKNGGK